MGAEKHKYRLCPGLVHVQGLSNFCPVKIGGIHNLEEEEQKSKLCPGFVHVQRLSKPCQAVIIFSNHEDVNPDDGFPGPKLVQSLSNEEKCDFLNLLDSACTNSGCRCPNPVQGV